MLKKIAFIGAGSMAEAIISGIIKKDFLKASQVFVTNRSDQERLNFLNKHYQVQAIPDKKTVMEQADVIVLSMKPNDVGSAIDSIKEYIKPNQLIISVAAGISTEYIERLVGKSIPVIRVMPNTSAAVGLSATAIAKGMHVLDQHSIMSESLFQTIGTTTMIDEKDMHIVTGVSGSGPAYIYYLVEAMEQAAIDGGLEKNTAKSLITQTVIGAGEMLKHSGTSAEELRKRITSPAGTTEAGIETLVKYDFQKAIIECVKSAKDRSVELGKE